MILSRLKECSAEPHLWCNVDPVTLTGLALGGLAGVGASAFSGGSSTPAPTPPPAQAAPAQSPQGQTTPKPQQQSFIGTAAAPPPTQSGQKTLLGQ